MEKDKEAKEMAERFVMAVSRNSPFVQNTDGIFEHKCEVFVPTMGLRQVRGSGFIYADTEICNYILQQKFVCHDCGKIEWRDVPIVYQ